MVFDGRDYQGNIVEAPLIELAGFVRIEVIAREVWTDDPVDCDDYNLASGPAFEPCESFIVDVDPEETDITYLDLDGDPIEDEDDGEDSWLDGSYEE